MSRFDTRIVGDQSVKFWHKDSKMNECWGDRSVTFRHQDNKENESWIMLIYSDLMNLFPKWVWCGGLSPHRCVWVVPNGYGTCCCHMLSIWLILCYYLIYIAFYFELADDTYSVLVLCTDPYLYVFFLLIVECSERTVVFNSTATLANLHQVKFQGELSFLARTEFSLIHVLMSLKFGHGPFVFLF